jgi:hypothetical protein
MKKTIDFDSNTDFSKLERTPEEGASASCAD